MIIWISKAYNLIDIICSMDWSTPGVHMAYYVTTEGCIFHFDGLMKSGFYLKKMFFGFE